MSVKTHIFQFEGAVLFLPKNLPYDIYAYKGVVCWLVYS